MSAVNRIRLLFWVLVAVAIAATAFLSASLAEVASPATGIKVALGGIVAVASAGLALRILLVLSPRARARSGDAKGDAHW